MVCASSEALLRELIEIAVPICQQAEKALPRRGPGRKPEFADWAVAALIIVAVVRRKTSKSSQFRYLKAHETQLNELLKLNRFPCRSTFFDRYRRGWQLFQKAIELEGRVAIERGWANPQVLAVDKSLVAARGPVWHQRQGKKRRVRGADPDAGWGRSEHDGWVYGYGFEAVVSAPKEGTVWPLLASVDSANRNESLSFRKKIPQLPRQTRYVLADKGYDADANCEAIEWKTDGTRTGRRFVCPLIQRATTRRTPSRLWRRTKVRKQRLRHRQARAAFCKSKRGKKLYARRRQTAEPFNSWLKDLFALEDRVWHRGLSNNRTQLLAAIFTSQLLLHLNRRHRVPNGCVKWIMDLF
jgi:Transposase DDE domain